jgi:quercetin dioxygenase-like cupin family protein
MGPRNTIGSDILDQATLGLLAAALRPLPLSAELQSRMRVRVLADARKRHTEVVLANEGEWKPLLPGITIKTLRLDTEKGTQTSLWKLESGARVPPHPHSKEEECMVMQGYVVHDGRRYATGDFLFARPGVMHGDFFAPEGAVLMIRSELVPDAAVLARLADKG